MQATIDAEVVVELHELGVAHSEQGLELPVRDGIKAFAQVERVQQGSCGFEGGAQELHRAGVLLALGVPRVGDLRDAQDQVVRIAVHEDGIVRLLQEGVELVTLRGDADHAQLGYSHIHMLRGCRVPVEAERAAGEGACEVRSALEVVQQVQRHARATRFAEPTEWSGEADGDLRTDAHRIEQVAVAQSGVGRAHIAGEGLLRLHGEIDLPLKESQRT